MFLGIEETITIDFEDEDETIVRISKEEARELLENLKELLGED